ncbi:MAG: DUF4258 domain-containing protein [Gammaproteobacteria bacterium]
MKARDAQNTQDPTEDYRPCLIVDDGLTRDDIERAIMKGRIEKKLSEDMRGTRYRIEGQARDGRLIHVVCRFKEEFDLISMTVYALTEDL